MISVFTFLMPASLETAITSGSSFCPCLIELFHLRPPRLEYLIRVQHCLKLRSPTSWWGQLLGGVRSNATREAAEGNLRCTLSLRGLHKGMTGIHPKISQRKKEKKLPIKQLNKEPVCFQRRCCEVVKSCGNLIVLCPQWDNERVQHLPQKLTSSIYCSSRDSSSSPRAASSGNPPNKTVRSHFNNCKRKGNYHFSVGSPLDFFIIPQ